MKRRAVVIAAAAASSAVFSEALRPRVRVSEHLPPIDLDKQIPVSFGPWVVDRTMVPVLPNAEVQARLDVLYTQVLARTYISPQGQRIMLSIAYGQDQGSDATAAHRPEFCYTAQGFSIENMGERVLQVNNVKLRVKNLFGRMGRRLEPITYWVTLNDTAVLPGLQRKLTQIKYGLQGYIPDGMLVRVSSFGASAAAEFDLHRVFLGALEQSLRPDLRPRYFGNSAA